MRRVLITGTAGFIGYHLAQLLLAEGFRVHGLDGMTDYYDVRLKQRRHQMLLQDLSSSATEVMLGYTPQSDYRAGLARLVNCFREHYKRQSHAVDQSLPDQGFQVVGTSGMRLMIRRCTSALYGAQ